MKDVWDIAELLKQYPLSEMLGFYRQKHPFLDPKLPIQALKQFEIPEFVGFQVLNGETTHTVRERIQTACLELERRKPTEKSLSIPDAYLTKIKQRGLNDGKNTKHTDIEPEV